MKRKRGAPLGNKNAFKHGFYSSVFRHHELMNLAANAPVDLEDEIGLLRVATSRLLASLEADGSPRDVETELSILRAICLGAISINGMVRTRLMLTRGTWGLMPAVDRSDPDAAGAHGPGPSRGGSESVD